MKHKKYCKIENSYRQKTLNYISEIVPVDETWIVQEKIHGANFQVSYDGKEVRFGSRNQFLPTDELSKFYHADVLVEWLTHKIEIIYQFLNECDSYFDTVTLYGELFGGSYPGHNHKEGVSQVQKGVYYSPDLEFFAFDIYLENENPEMPMDESRYLNYEFLMDVFKTCGIPYPTILHVGGFVDCLQYPNDQDSLVPGQCGFPKVLNNVMEGVVIKPRINYYMGCGSRVILKNKNDKFSEKQKADKVKVPETLSNSVQNALNVMAQYINENRLNAVMSKLGHGIEDKHIGKLIGELTRDALADFWKDQEGGFTKQEMKTFNRETSKLAKNLILSLR